MKDKAAEDRIRLATRILFQKLRGGGAPPTLEDFARLRFLAETDAERRMPLEQLAHIVLLREAKRTGFEPPAPQIGTSNLN